MGIEADLKKALFARIEAFADIRVLEIEGENASFPSKPNNKGYIQVRHFPNRNPSDPTWGDEQIKQGFLQIGIIDTKQKGSIKPSELADEILALFTKGTKIKQGAVLVVIDQHPTLLSVVQDGQKSIYPVSIPYRAYVNF